MCNELAMINLPVSFRLSISHCLICMIMSPHKMYVKALLLFAAKYLPKMVPGIGRTGEAWLGKILKFFVAVV